MATFFCSSEDHLLSSDIQSGHRFEVISGEPTATVDDFMIELLIKIFEKFRQVCYLDHCFFAV
jgi:hypothetical protein